MMEYLEDTCKREVLTTATLAWSEPFVNTDPNGKLLWEAQYICARTYLAADEIMLRIGSPEQDVYAKLGRPLDINTSVGRWGTRKQMVYRGVYVYIENGQVSSWQTH
nr:hypothetical protein [Thiocapsa sp. KS1]